MPASKIAIAIPAVELSRTDRKFVSAMSRFPQLYKLQNAYIKIFFSNDDVR